MKDQSKRNAILSFELDDPDAGLKFSERLARENGWSPDYTRRAITEYKRFLILCAETGQAMTPSDEVDQVWHLHLCYTESYWNGLCRGVLGRPLHHGPTKGGRRESDKFHDWYENTLSAYQDAFGDVPPSDIWPSSDIRFARQNFKRVDCNSNLVVSKRKILMGILSAGAAMGLAGCATYMVASEGGTPWVTIIVVAVILIIVLKLIAKGGGKGGSGGGCGWFGGCSSGCSSGCGGCGGD